MTKNELIAKLQKMGGDPEVRISGASIEDVVLEPAYVDICGVDSYPEYIDIEAGTN